MIEKLKSVYLVWYAYYLILPKPHRYSLGVKIDTLFIESIEGASAAAFLPKNEKLPYVRFALKKVDSIKVLLLVLWETKSIDNKKYIAISEKIEEVGKMLGGWQGQLVKASEISSRSRG